MQLSFDRDQELCRLTIGLDWDPLKRGIHTIVDVRGANRLDTQLCTYSRERQRVSDVAGLPDFVKAVTAAALYMPAGACSVAWALAHRIEVPVLTAEEEAMLPGSR